MEALVDVKRFAQRRHAHNYICSQWVTRLPVFNMFRPGHVQGVDFNWCIPSTLFRIHLEGICQAILSSANI